MPEPGFVLNLRTEEALKEIDAAIDDAYRENLQLAKARAQALSPRKTGTNARSITVTYRRTAKGEPRGTMYTQSGYGGFLETGTRNTPAQPYIYPAAQSVFGRLVETIKVKLKR